MEKPVKIHLHASKVDGVCCATCRFWDHDGNERATNGYCELVECKDRHVGRTAITLGGAKLWTLAEHFCSMWESE